MCKGASSKTILDYNLVRFGVCMIKLRHRENANFKMYASPKKTELPPEKSRTP